MNSTSPLPTPIQAVRFRPVAGYPRHYVSEYGHLWRQYKNGKIRQLRAWRSGNGYWYYTLCINGKRSKVSKHLLVGRAFIPVPELDHDGQYLVLNHKDGCKDNCHVNNLEWLKGNGNVLHAMHTGLRG